MFFFGCKEVWKVHWSAPGNVQSEIKAGKHEVSSQSDWTKAAGGEYYVDGEINFVIFSSNRAIN